MRRTRRRPYALRSSSVASPQMTTNSSPPNRAATSISLAWSERMPATKRMASSPAACPSRSLISLSVSMSIWTTPYLRPSRLNMANCWASAASR